MKRGKNGPPRSSRLLPFSGSVFRFQNLRFPDSPIPRFVFPLWCSPSRLPLSSKILRISKMQFRRTGERAYLRKITWVANCVRSLYRTEPKYTQFWTKSCLVMTNFLKLTVKDICAALGVPKHRVRVWTKLPPFSHRMTQDRNPHPDISIWAKPR